jgi:hypothetical protein
MIAASSMALLADSRHGSRGGALPWALLVVGSAASLAANVAVAEPTLIGRLIAAWPSLALIGSYELLMRQIRHSAHQPPATASAYTPKTPNATAGPGSDPAPAPTTIANRAGAPTATSSLPRREAPPSAPAGRAVTSPATTRVTSHTRTPDDPNAPMDAARPRQRQQTADLRLRAWQWATLVVYSSRHAGRGP